MIHRIVKHTKASGTYEVAGKTGKAIAALMPKTVELHEMRTPVRRLLVLTIELLVGMLVLGALVLGLFYYSLEKGPIDLDFVVPSIEKAINGELADLSVRIESAFVGKNTSSAGVHFRLRNIVLYNKQGQAIANAPLAAVDLNGRALMWGRVAPSQVVFIKPTLDIAYSEGSGLSLSYAPATGSGDKPAGTISAGGSGLSTSIGKIQIMKAVSAAFEEARAHRNTTSYLTQFGVREATVRFSRADGQYSWKLPDFIIDLKHGKKGSLIRGFGKLGIGEKHENIEPWKLRFQTRQFEQTQDLQLDVGFKDITPVSLHRLLPDLKKLKIFNIPFSGKINAKLNNAGELQSAFANIHLSAGRILIPWLNKANDGIEELSLDAGELKLAYSREGSKLHVLPSPFKWGKNSTILSGIIEAQNAGAASQTWQFTIKGSETRLAADDFNLGPMIIDEWWITGTFNPDQDEVRIAGFYLNAGNATFNMKGRIEALSTQPGLFLEGKVSSVSIPVLKRLWPAIFAIEARKWVGASIPQGKVVDGKFRVAIPPGILDKLPERADLTAEMVQMKLRLQDLVVDYLPGFVPVNIPDATVKISGRQLTVDIPKGRVFLNRGKALKVSHGSYTISDLREDIPQSDLSFRIAGDAQDLHRFINQPALKMPRTTDIAAGRIKGKLKGVVTMHIPLKNDLVFTDISLNGDLRLREMKSDRLFGDIGVDGGTVNIRISEKAVGADGGVVIRGLPVKLNWQHIFGNNKLRQPPLRLSAVLGKTSRKKLGLEAINKIVQGDIPVVITVLPKGQDDKVTQVRADLTSARVNNTAIGWTKPPGVAAVLQFDVGKGDANNIVLQNLNLVGNELMLEGGMTLNSNTRRVEKFSFPQISLPLIENMAVEGERDMTGLMKIKANVQRIQGMELLRSRFFGQKGAKTAPTRGASATDYDLSARIATVTGGKGSYVSGARLEIRNRNGKFSWLDFKGHLNGQSSLAVLLEPSPKGNRILKAESTDAGAAFRMIGLYPNIEGGRLSLLVDMDPRGTSEKRGTLWVKKFSVISSQKITSHMKTSDVFNNSLIRSRQTGKRRVRRKMMRTRMKFDQLKAPFSFGDGQFILHDSYVNGPVIGATLRGKIDFRTERMRLGGTYIPLYGLNSAIGEIPVLSDLLVGRQGEGVFGVTFAIEGPTAKPTVVVNPVSLLTPGVFRQIFDFNNSVKNRQFRKLPKSSGNRKRTRRRQYGN